MWKDGQKSSQCHILSSYFYNTLLSLPSATGGEVKWKSPMSLKHTFYIEDINNHRFIQVRKNFQRSSSPNSYSVYIQQVAQGHVQLICKYLWRCRFHSLSGQPITVLDHLYGFFFFLYRRILFHFLILCSNLCLLPLSFYSAPLRSLALSSLHSHTSCL